MKRVLLCLFLILILIDVPVVYANWFTDLFDDYLVGWANKIKKCTGADGKKHNIGESWKVDCNTCTCSSGGKADCTKNECLKLCKSTNSLPAGQEKVYTFNNFDYAVEVTSISSNKAQFIVNSKSFSLRPKSIQEISRRVYFSLEKLSQNKAYFCINGVAGAEKKINEFAEAVLSLGDIGYKVVSSSNINFNDFSIKVDLDGDGVVGNTNKEKESIKRNGYFILAEYGKMQYLGAEKRTSENPILFFNDAENDKRIELGYTIQSKQKCTDSDGGLNYTVRGTTSLARFSLSSAAVKWKDLCLKDYGNYLRKEYSPGEGITKMNGLLEGSCGPNPNEPGVISAYECPNGCKDGACIKQITIDLKDYPNMFVKDGKFNGIFVVGDGSEAEYVVSMTEIMSGLENMRQDGAIGKIGTGTSKLASEVGSLNRNIISIGSACVNKITAKIEGNLKDCNAGLAQGKGVIKLYTHDGYVHLVVKGYSSRDARAAAKVLADYASYELKGDEYTVPS